jgi:hypothetical protein
LPRCADVGAVGQENMEIGPREALMTDLRKALEPDQPLRMLVTFRLARYAEFADKWGAYATEALVNYIASCLPSSTGPASFYHRIRKDELCGLIGGQLNGVEGGFSAAARAVDEMLGSSGISLGFGTAILPHEAREANEALALVDSRIKGVLTGELMPRSPSSLPTGRSQVIKPAG